MRSSAAAMLLRNTVPVSAAQLQNRRVFLDVLLPAVDLLLRFTTVAGLCTEPFLLRAALVRCVRIV